MTDQDTNCGFAAIIGAPNVGKSSLINRMMGAKISIVSPKVQTTRRKVLGIAIREQGQLIFIDTPGIFNARKRLERAIVEAAWSGIDDTDLVVFVIDAERGLDRNGQMILDGLKKRPNLAAIAVINKIDLIRKQECLALIQTLSEAHTFEDVFLVSAESGEGCEAIVDNLFSRLRPGPWLYPDDQLSDLNDRELAAEITREQVFRQLHQELPYSITVETEEWIEGPESVRIDQIIYVERDSQKAIVLGKKGSRIRQIGELARKEVGELIDKEVHLFLFVKVRPNWRDDPERYDLMGLEFPKDNP